jgi:hypothetical protein
MFFGGFVATRTDCAYIHPETGTVKRAIEKRFGPGMRYARDVPGPYTAPLLGARHASPSRRMLPADDDISAPIQA